MAAPARACTDAEEFVRTQTFHCKYLNADLTPASCTKRQKTRMIEVRTYGQKFNRGADLQSVYCRSGKCEQGHLVRLGTGGGQGSSARDTTRHATTNGRRNGR